MTVILASPPPTHSLIPRQDKTAVLLKIWRAPGVSASAITYYNTNFGLCHIMLLDVCTSNNKGCDNLCLGDL